MAEDKRGEASSEEKYRQERRKKEKGEEEWSAVYVVV
jgi:hypothetical protein